ncbi:MAG: isocitrate/isopropylmalate family dehydrogenase [Pseudomonadota bacterium]
MPRKFEIAVFDGDGIGPEIIRPTLEVLDLLSARSSEYALRFNLLPAGASHFAETGTALPRSSIDKARAADAILLSAMGDPSVRYPDGTEVVPQIDLRMELDLFAGVRPVRIPAGAITPLKLPKGKHVDFVLLRESTEGLFFTKGTGAVMEDAAEETLRITRDKTEQLVRFAVELARGRRGKGVGAGKVTCIDKANVFRAFAFFRSIFDAEMARASDLDADHAYVDAAALWMVQKPWVFDVMVTENMFGDILSDLGAGLMGGLGLAPSADIGHRHAVFQPCHGSAPDIAGQGRANPFAMILSAAMMLDWLGSREKLPQMQADARLIQDAVDEAIVERRNLTADLGGHATTQQASRGIVEHLRAAV